MTTKSHVRRPATPSSPTFAPTTQSLLEETASGLHSIGDPEILRLELTALFCSNRCPGDLILKTYDLARDMRGARVPVIGGFQTPMEKECLRLLLRGSQPVVVCPARGIDNMRIPRDWRGPLNAGRMLVLSPFPSSRRRPTAETAAQRNDLVAALAQQVFIAHAAPGGKTEAFARKLAASGKPLLTLPSPANTNLVGLGAEVVGHTDTLRIRHEGNVKGIHAVPGTELSRTDADLSQDGSLTRYIVT